MYVPKFNAVDDPAEIEAMVIAAGAGELVTVNADGTPIATRLPVLWDGGDRLTAHVARANPHWRTISDGARALVIVGGADAYISPSWYPAKAEHGKVVPTWNYTAVHLTGTVTVHDDPEWVRSMVTALTERHESDRSAPWAVTDAPDDYIDSMLRAIVGIEVTVERVDAKAKLSQNRSLDDRQGVIAGLLESSAADPLATAMATTLTP